MFGDNVIDISERMIPRKLCRQIIFLKDKSFVECEARTIDEAVEGVVELALAAGDKPRLHWWQFYRVQWPAICVEEYKRQHP